MESTSRRVRSFALSLFIFSAAPLLASAQETSATDTTPFRRGQWAAQFGGGLNLVSLGALRFTSPRRAWLVDARFDGSHSDVTETVRTPTGDATASGYDSRASTNLRIGRRFYQARGRQVVSFFTVGVLGGYSHNADGGSIYAPGRSASGWNLGGFGELGASYLITPRISFGGAAGLTFSYSRSRDSGFRYRTTSYGITASGLAFSATIYF